MTSIGARARQINSDSGYFIAVGSLGNQIFSTPDNSSVVAPWASTGVSRAAGDTYSTAINRASTVGALFKDMGKTVVSSGTYFRKIQMVVPQGTGAGSVVAGATSTFGVAGVATGTGVPDFYTGYIKLGFDGQGLPAPVAQFGR
jgi:hypothetical protein